MDKRFIEDSAFLGDELEMAREERMEQHDLGIVFTRQESRNYTFDDTCMDLFGSIISY